MWFSAPKLKGRPRRKRKKRSASPGESSNESEASVASTSKSTSTITSTSLVIPTVGRPPSSGVRRSERKTSAEEKKFITDVQSFMNSRGTPVGKMPLLGYRQSQYLVIFSRISYPMTGLATGRARPISLIFPMSIRAIPVAIWLPDCRELRHSRVSFSLNLNHIRPVFIVLTIFFFFSP